MSPRRARVITPGPRPPGLVDEYRLNVHPVVLGDGLAMFDAPARMTLVGSSAFPSGAVAQTYRPA